MGGGGGGEGKKIQVCVAFSIAYYKDLKTDDLESDDAYLEAKVKLNTDLTLCLDLSVSGVLIFRYHSLVHRIGPGLNLLLQIHK